MRQTVSRSIALLAAMALPALAAEWKPIDPLELSLTKGRIDPDAGAETLLWDVRLEDKNQGVDVQTIWNHYVRIKIYNEKEKYNEWEFLYDLTKDKAGMGAALGAGMQQPQVQGQQPGGPGQAVPGQSPFGLPVQGGQPGVTNPILGPQQQPPRPR